MTKITLDVHRFPCLNDNYGYLVHEAYSGETAAIDTAVQQIGVDFRQGQLFQNAANLAAALDQLESSNHSWQTAR